MLRQPQDDTPLADGESVPEAITDTQSLVAVCERLAKAAFLTVDTEFMREKTYFSKLCLIQIASPDEAHIIDPLAPDIDLSSFWHLMNNEPVQKVLHSARQDLEIFYHASGALPRPMFDTQVAAMVLGFSESTGYQVLVEHYCNTKLDKSSRFTDWSRRPLSPAQMKYAIGDVTYLRDVYTSMVDQLKKNDREDWLGEDMDILTSPETYAIRPDLAWRRLKHRSRDPKFLGKLKAVGAWREETAQVIDIPRGRLISDDAILTIAAQVPRSTDDMAKCRGISDGFARGKYGQAVLDLLRNADPLPNEELPPRKDRSVLRSNPLGDLLKLLLKARAQEIGVAPKLIASAEDLDRLANTAGDDLPLMRGWRKTAFGAEAQALKDGRIALTARGKAIEIVELE